MCTCAPLDEGPAGHAWLHTRRHLGHYASLALQVTSVHTHCFPHSDSCVWPHFILSVSPGSWSPCPLTKIPPLTAHCTLHACRFLVVDETDRLLKQSYQEWLPRVLEELSERHHSNEWAEAVASVEDDAGPALRTSQLPYSQHRWV